ncbi:class I SAM-dependent DNA methyltransferase [Clostridium sp. C105KSO13]|uniref:class I SAM-dependent DNA methyltransferase n=1 Tax=Clostridium sp. C105KSO13 TaxID=1776045 RepID=UPI00074080C5|nr:class I SAM-dependent methyltransferase [Clostridium sp. C105KSO13]CUX39034.1 Glycine/sarcosine N-methyltransferase [Clostridium sp. C105KSO13]
MDSKNEFNAYGSFAAVYDTFMDNVPYEEWGTYLHGFLEEYNIEDGLVLDLGCGTGTMTEFMAALGYDMIGVDNSVDMLGIALEKREKSGHDILYLQQDMREFELYGTVRAIFSICDSLNYITQPKDLKQVFHWVHNYLDPDGVFIFDFNTEYKYREILGDTTIAEDREKCSFIWENYYYEEERINEYELSLFIKDEELSPGNGNVYRKYHETHFQRGYTLDEIKQLVISAGMKFFAAYDAFTRDAPSEISERIYVIAGKEKL